MRKNWADERRGMELDWPKRCLIINGIARGLLYLHQDSRLRIIHRDLNAGNILLDSEMSPKISEFGMAESFGANQIEANTERLVGTLYVYLVMLYTVSFNFFEIHLFAILLQWLHAPRECK